MPLISIIIPVYNEEGNIPELYKRLTQTLIKLAGFDYEIIFIDDYSHDQSVKQIISLRNNDPKIKLIELSRNFGHQIALIAGLNHASGDLIITMDGDLQHPPELIPKMIATQKEGYDIIYTKRQETKDATFFKGLSSKLFYLLFNKIAENKIPPGSADFRLITKRILNEFNKFSEKKLFLRGLFPFMGFKSTVIEYNADKRFAGKSSYSFAKMLQLCSVAIVSFSGKLLRVPIYLGIVISIGALIYSGLIVYNFFLGNVIAGWSSLVVSILFLSSIQLIFLGIIGEYLYVMFDEIKNRPLYFI